MPIKLGVRGHAVSYFPDKQEKLTLPWDGPITVRELLLKLGVDPLLIMMVMINGQKVSKDQPIEDGDEVLLMSPPSGG